MLQQWEHRAIDLNQQPRASNDIDLLNDAGKEGWELLAITVNRIAYLKREIGTPYSPSRRCKTGSVF